MHDNQYNDLFNRADCVPSLFTFSEPLNESDAALIVENELGCFKIDTMFAAVGFVLCDVPFDPYLYLQHRTYIDLLSRDRERLSLRGEGRRCREHS